MPAEPSPAGTMIISITVTYHPDLSLLERQLLSMREQVNRMVVVDNGSPDALQAPLRDLCIRLNALLHAVGYNAGIAHAQNLGIQQAKELGADWLLLLDQDSEAQPGMVATLRKALERYPRAAAAGPSSVDQRTGRQSFFVRDAGVWPRHWQPGAERPAEPVEVGFLIASGSLLRRAAVPEREPMLASWFIDHIDSEWCLRVRAQGWSLLGVSDAVLQHRLGDRISRIWLLRWRHVAHHSPLRDYYMFRNSVLLACKPFVPWRWKLYFLSRLFQFAGFFLVLTPDRAQRVRMMASGILDGLCGKTGPKT